MDSDNSVFPIGASYAPYWRAKAVDSSEWEQDLRNMKSVGMSYVSVFASWHRIEREEGVYDFSDLDKIFALAEKVGLKISVGLGVHISYSIYPPRYVMRKYTGTDMIDQFGQPDVSGSYVQPCFEDEWYYGRAELFYKALVKRFAAHPALMQWRVWGEATVEKYCYCEKHQRMFREYLRNKYGTIEVFNQAWGTEGPSDYISFDEVFPPKKSGRFYGFHERLDWQEFLDDSLTATVKRVNGWIKEADPKHATLGEYWLPNCNSSGGGDDIWKLSKVVDQVGLSIYNKAVKNYAMDMDLMNSAARMNGKQAWTIEVQGASRLFGWDEPSSPKTGQMTLWMWQFIAHESKGVFYWTWRARISDNEGGEFGMVRRDGTLPQRTLEMAEDFRLAHKLAPLLLPASRKPEVAIFISREAEHLAAIDHVDKQGAMNYYMHSVHSAHELLWREGYPADFISTSNLDKLSNYKVLVMPFAFCIGKETVSEIKKFAENGGIVIADFLLGSKNTRGYCDPVIPGFGLGELFGLKEDEIYAAKSDTIRLGSGMDVNAFKFIQTCRLEKAVPFAYYNGKPVFTRNKFGKGEAVFLGTTFFHRDAWLNSENNRRLFYDILGSCGVNVPVKFSGGRKNEPDSPETVILKTTGGKEIVFLLNHSGETVSGMISARSGASAVTDLKTGEKVKSSRGNGHIEFHAEAASMKCSIYLLGSQD